MYLALTGHRLKGRDVLHGGIATHLIGKEKIPSLLSELTESCDDPIMKKDPHYVVKSILDKYHKESLNIDDRSFSLTPHLELIDKCFSGGSVEDIQMSLLNDGSDWSINQLQGLAPIHKFPFSFGYHPSTHPIYTGLVDTQLVKYIY
uniref:3-hydroxyisobutyryl-CoA hydrolase n=1 Tax=Amphimedon queenslandica TaxID=400682 RepID=A0A1X7SM53_AMPQE